MRHEKTKLLASVLAVVLCVAAFSVTAFASDDAWCEYGDYDMPEASASDGVTGTPTQTAKPTPTVKPAPEPEPSSKPENPPQEEDDTSGGEPLTPSGNLNLVDDVLQTDSTPDDASGNKKGDELEEKQFITVQSKNGNYFYIVIDRSGKAENVHFLNQVDEADLLALMEDDSAEEKPLVCICADKCMAGAINLSCPVCQTTMSECTGKEPAPEPSPEPDTEPEKPKSGGTAPLLIVLALAMAGGAVYYFKFRKPKADTKGPVDLDDYDFGEDDEDDYEYEKDDADEPEARNEGD